MKVTFLKDIKAGAGADQKLWRLESGAHLITSVANHGPFCETYIFEADGTGKITNWLELPGSIRGVVDHEQALRNGGYEL